MAITIASDANNDLPGGAHVNGRSSEAPRTPNAAATSQHGSATDRQWHFPYGPSSQFHRSERPRPAHHMRHNSYTPAAPSLSTERRAGHRRSHSGVQRNPWASSPIRDLGNSPQTRRSKDTNKSGTMGITTTPTTGPHTPVKAPRWPSEHLRDSPFSDYFTDESRSTDIHCTSGHLAPHIQRILVRINKLQAELMRTDQSRAVCQLIERKVDDIESSLLPLQGHAPVQNVMTDSGLFVEDDVDDDKPYFSSAQAQHRPHSAFDNHLESFEQRRARTDFLLLKSRHIISNVTKAQQEFRQRLVDSKDIHDQYASSIAEKDQEVQQLRSANDALRSSLAAKHDELQSLGLQLQKFKLGPDCTTPSDDSMNSPDTNASQLVDETVSCRPHESEAANDGDETTSQDCIVAHRLDLHNAEQLKAQIFELSPEQLKLGSTEEDPSVERDEIEQERHDIGKTQDCLDCDYTVVRAVVDGPQPSWQLDAVSQGTQTDTFFCNAKTTSTQSHDTALDRNECGHSEVAFTGHGGYEIRHNQVPVDAVGALYPCDPEPQDISAPGEIKLQLLTDHAQASRVRLAWNELWHGLSELTGMGEERF